MEELLGRHQTKLHAFILKLTGNKFDCDDIFQEVVCKSFFKINTFKASSAFRTWLFAIAYNEFKQFKRKSGRFLKLKEKLTFFQSNQTAYECDAALSIDLANALNQLESNERNIIILCLLEGLSHSDASVITDLPLGTVKTIVRRARTKLKNVLEVYGYIGEET